MNRSIIQTALTNKALPLELNYREASVQINESDLDDFTESHGTGQRKPLSYEFACLLRTI